MANTSEYPAVDLYVIRIGSEEYVAKRLHESEKEEWYAYMVYGFEGMSETHIIQHQSGIIRQLTGEEALIHAIRHSEG